MKVVSDTDFTVSDSPLHLSTILVSLREHFHHENNLRHYPFSPVQPTASGIIWGAGPVFLLDSASEPALGAGKWGLGPTGVALKQTGPWTYGALANHIWSIGGDSTRSDVNATFLQPFVAYITPTSTTFSLNTESTYDWETKQWSVPLNLTAAQLLKIGNQMVSVGGGVRYWADSPDGGSDDWGLRLLVTFLFPR